MKCPEQSEKAFTEAMKRLEALLESEHPEELHALQSLLKQKELLAVQHIELCTMQQELKASRKHFADLYDLAPAGYLTFDSKGNILEINLPATRLLADHRSQLIGKSFTSYIFQSNHLRFFQHLFQCRQLKGECITTEFSLLVKNQVVIVQCISTFDQKKEGTEQYHTFMIDITESKRVDAVLRQELFHEKELLEMNARQEMEKYRQACELLGKKTLELQRHLEQERYKSRVESIKSKYINAVAAKDTQAREQQNMSNSHETRADNHSLPVLTGSDQVEQELALNANSLTNQTVRFAEKQEHLQIFERKLVEALRSPSSKSRKLVRELLQDVKHNLHTRADQQLFERRLGETDRTFLHALTARYPMLTPVELKICSFLRINLSTKEIAQLMHISEKTVENHRYRIRRKIELRPEVSLITFLTSL